MCVQGFFFLLFCSVAVSGDPAQGKTGGIQRPKNNVQCLCTYIVVGLLLSRNKYTLLHFDKFCPTTVDNMRNYRMCCQPDEKVLLGGRASSLHGGLVKKVFLGGGTRYLEFVPMYVKAWTTFQHPVRYPVSKPALCKSTVVQPQQQQECPREGRGDPPFPPPPHPSQSVFSPYSIQKVGIGHICFRWGERGEKERESFGVRSRRRRLSLSWGAGAPVSSLPPSSHLPHPLSQIIDKMLDLKKLKMSINCQYPLAIPVITVLVWTNFGLPHRFPEKNRGGTNMPLSATVVTDICFPPPPPPPPPFSCDGRRREGKEKKRGGRYESHPLRRKNTQFSADAARERTCVRAIIAISII